MERKCVFCEVVNEFLNVTFVNFRLSTSNLWIPADEADGTIGTG
jgi:hypothetical protein